MPAKKTKARVVKKTPVKRVVRKAIVEEKAEETPQVAPTVAKESLDTLFTNAQPDAKETGAAPSETPLSANVSPSAPNISVAPIASSQTVTGLTPPTPPVINVPEQQPASADLAPLGSASAQVAAPQPGVQAPAAAAADITTSQPAAAAPLPPDSGPIPMDEGSGGSKKIITIVLVVLLLIAAVLGGIFYYVSTFGSDMGKKKEPVTTAAKATATPTPEEASGSGDIEIAELSVQVLNGSGIAGEAGKVEELLKNEGFAIIETGNADAYTYEETEVSLKKDGEKDIYEALKNALSETYILAKSSDFLKDSNEYDIIIIVGSNKVSEEEEDEEQ